MPGRRLRLTKNAKAGLALASGLFLYLCHSTVSIPSNLEDFQFGATIHCSELKVLKVRWTFNSARRFIALSSGCSCRFGIWCNRILLSSADGVKANGGDTLGDKVRFD